MELASLAFPGFYLILLGTDWVDADQLFVAQHGDISDFFAQQGEAAFRSQETQILRQQLAKPGSWVFATGGGLVTQAVNRQLLTASGLPVLYLHASASTLARRLARDTSGTRPTLVGGTSPAAEAEQLLAEREPWYRGVATAVIDAQQPLSRVVEACQQALQERGKRRQ